MAGDWMKIEKDTPEKPEMYRIAKILGISLGDAFLACFRVWRWADSNSEEGHLKSVAAAIDDNAKVPNFHIALQEVGWLNLRTDSVEFPNFFRHMGISAKRRAIDAVRKMSERTSDKTRTREEKRREENTNPPTPKGGAPQSRNGDHSILEVDNPFSQFWTAYPRHQDRKAAQKAFAKLAPDAPMLEMILAAIARQKVSGCLEPRTAEDGSSVIPYPATWLNHRRWEDEQVLPGFKSVDDKLRETREDNERTFGGRP